MTLVEELRVTLRLIPIITSPTTPAVVDPTLQICKEAQVCPCGPVRRDVQATGSPSLVYPSPRVVFRSQECQLITV